MTRKYIFFLNQIRLYARPDAIRRGSGDYALNITRRLIEFYEDYFKVPYSLPKLGKLFLILLVKSEVHMCIGYAIFREPFRH